MTPRSRLLLPLTLAALIAALACKETVRPADPEPGDLFVRLTTPHATDAAVRITLSGPGIGALSAVGDRLLYALPDGAESRKIAVFGALVTGDVFSFAVPDVHHPERYTVTLVQVATETNALRLPLAGYSLSIHD